MDFSFHDLNVQNDLSGKVNFRSQKETFAEDKTQIVWSILFLQIVHT